MTAKKRVKKHRLFWHMVRLQIFLILIILGGTGYYYLGGYGAQVAELHEKAIDIVAASDEKDFVPSQTSEVYDKDGNLISERSGDKDATYVTYEDIPASYIATIISIEDKKYYKHNGVDIKAVLRATKAMILNRRVTQGGSTITMQLAKLMFMDSTSRTWQYKVEQMFIAVELEKKYSKSQIMEFYLNNIYFANGYYGISAACTGYFSCELDQLDTSQVAFLLAIPNSPTYYDPIANLSHTIDRRNLILKNMWVDGKLTDEAYYMAINEDLALNLKDDDKKLWNNYVDTYVYKCATESMMKNSGFDIKYYFESDEEKKAYNENYDELYSSCQKELFTGGYKIYTSIDMDLENKLQQSVDDVLAEFTDMTEEGIYKLQGSAACIDNETGYLVAIVGGRSQDFTTYTLNRAYQSHRQPGSSIKPLIVYTPSFERGYTPDDVIDDHKWEDGPENAGNYYYGEVPIRTAVAKSLNTVAWQLYEELTPKVGLSYLKNMNFSNICSDDYVLPTCLGGFTTGMSAVEMASGYATIENDGMYRTPTCIKQIIDSNDNVVFSSEQVETIIYQETAARMMTDVMTTVMSEGTGRNLKLENDISCAGKTGTTNDSKDGWFCGFTRYYTTAVWVGCDSPKKVEGLTGSSYPGSIWKEFMDMAHENLTNIDFLPYAQMSEEYVDEQNQKKKEKEDAYKNQRDYTDELNGRDSNDENSNNENSNNGDESDNNDSGDSNSRDRTSTGDKRDSSNSRDSNTSGDNSTSVDSDGIVEDGVIQDANPSADANVPVDDANQVPIE